MRGPLRIVCVTAAVVIASHARAAEKTMDIAFFGEWCSWFRDKNTASYLLPSATEGRCTDILSIYKDGFEFADEQTSCKPVTSRLGKDTDPSGTTYTATVTARCSPGGLRPGPTAGKLRTFKFQRYKQNLSVTTK